MSTDDSAPVLGGFEYGIVRRKVRQLIGQAGYTATDREDLEQDLFVRLVQGLSSFDPARGHRHTFVTTVVERAVAGLLRHRKAAKRAPTSSPKLNRGAADRHAKDEQVCRHGHREKVLWELASDVDTVVDSLPNRLRDLAVRLKHQSLAECARDLGVPRTTLNSALESLRTRFNSSGLQDYLR